ncbi:MAG: phosphoglycerate kinase [Candidatus Latescibacteria bacterium]|nr:phosphoglycerate kinase [Candidatus Latescibacterota bacterium]NIO27279.1 phosphoglycerate kinase [Candidatus Latescibacterota bacterium]NIO54803.1 phosphoglycerate kinase [Candidatus Latescibacterota bacterium]NIT00886.1 phosphoglycerate kinase [Candidatus Latescibacterota bacterium]NIT37809.1 phosphoglycerate kinase [Candidatus Latescibacterota bacterium]
MKKLSVRDCDVRGKRVLVRVDFNVPLDSDKNITDDTRIVSALPTIKSVLDRGGKLILMSHLGRPRGKRNEDLSLTPVAYRLGDLLDNPLKFATDCIGKEVRSKVNSMKDGEIILLENLRFHPGEEANDSDFSRELASLGDIYVNDAFGTAHRAHASTVGVTEHFDIRAAGILMEEELSALVGILESPERPFVAVLGGAKIEGKINLIRTLLSKVDVLLVGGGMMFTFFKASGLEIGRSIVDESYLDMCKELLGQIRGGPSKLLLPVDAIVAKEIEDGAPKREVSSADIPEDWIGVDIGPKTVSLFKEEIGKAKTIFWNGPMGVFEKPGFADGTKAVAQSIANTTERGTATIVGGGDSVAAIQLMGIAEKFTHVSTGGGASLELIEGKTLPGVEALCDVAEASCDA